MRRGIARHPRTRRTAVYSRRRRQRVHRRVASDAFVDVETVRYSVPYQLVRDHVDIAVDEQTVRIFHGTDLVATHPRSREPYARVLEPAHLAGLWRATTRLEPVDETLSALGRSLADYEAVVR